MRTVIIEKLPSSYLKFICPLGKQLKRKSSFEDLDKTENSTDVQGKGSQLQNLNEWNILASMLDRFFMILFVTLLGITYGAWYPSRAKFLT